MPLPRELLQELLGCAPPAHNARHPPTAAAAATIPGAAGRVGEGAASAGQSAAGVVGAVKGRGGDRQGLLQALHTQAGGTAGAGTCTAHASQGHSRRRLMHCTRKPGEQQGRTIRLNRGEQQAQRARRRNTHDKAHLGGGSEAMWTRARKHRRAMPHVATLKRKRRGYCRAPTRGHASTHAHSHKEAMHVKARAVAPHLPVLGHRLRRGPLVLRG